MEWISHQSRMPALSPCSGGHARHHSPSGERSLELLIGAALAENGANVVQIVRQDLAGEGNHEGLAEVEVS